MEELPEDLKFHILSNIDDLNTLYSVIQLNNYSHINFIYKYKNLKDYIKYLEGRYPDFVINLFGDIYKLTSYPILPFQEQYRSIIDNIDKIEASDVTYPIMIGEDDLGRLFITIKLKYRAKRDNNKYHKGDITESVSTFFQRYTNAHSCRWFFGTSRCIHLHEHVLPTYKDLDNYKKVINGEIVETEDFFVSL